MKNTTLFFILNNSSCAAFSDPRDFQANDMTGDIGSLTTDATPPANSFQLSRFSADPQIKPGD